MPMVTIPINDIDNTIVRPIIKSALAQLSYLTDMKINDITIVERGGGFKTSQIYRPQIPLKNMVDDYLVVSYKTTPHPTLQSTNKYFAEYLPIMAAPELGVNVIPLCFKTLLEMTVTFRSKSFGKIDGWLQNFRHLELTNNSTYEHDLEFLYNIPSPIIEYIIEVYNCTERVAPYGRTMKQFIEKYFTKGIIIKTNASNDKFIAAINAKQCNCLGQFTTMPEEIVSERNPPHSEITFTYTIVIDLVHSLSLTLNKFIHNQVMDVEYLQQYSQKKNKDSLVEKPLVFSGVLRKFLYHDDSFKLIANTTDGWVPTWLPAKTNTIFIIPIQLDPNDLTFIINLNDLSNGLLEQWMIDLLKKYFQYLCSVYGFPLCFELYYKGWETGMIKLTIDDLFNLRSILDLDLRLQYFLRLSVVSDWGLLNKVLLALLSKNPNDLLALIRILLPDYTFTKNELLGGGTIASESALNRLINTTLETNLGTGLHIQHLKINTFME